MQKNHKIAGQVSKSQAEPRKWLPNSGSVHGRSARYW